MKLFETLPANLLDSQDFLLGFEVEMVYSLDKISESELGNKLLKIHPNIIFGYDGTINTEGRLKNEQGREIKTPPLLPAESLSVLKQIFELVNQYGYTNASCGFHLNFSPIPEKLYQALDPFKFTINDLWTKIKTEFNRTGSRWCGPVWKPDHQTKVANKQSLFSLLQRDLVKPVLGKGADVNLINYFNENNMFRRIEVRAFGGEGYHTKFERITDYTNEIFKTFLDCCEV